MSDTYTKLFGSITASTIWQEPAHTRLVWITMLAMADQHGVVHASVPGLAHIANVPLADTELALKTLLGPDPYSRTKEHEGRRIEEVDGGWVLLNHAKFRGMRTPEDRREYFREKKREQREAERSASTMSTNVHSGPPESTGNHLSDTDQIKEQKHVGSSPTLALEADQPDPASRFEDFWRIYPRKEAKKGARGVWVSKRLDRKAESILADVAARIQSHRQWREGYIPHPATYLRGERWGDAIDHTEPRTRQAQQPEPAAPRRLREL